MGLRLSAERLLIPDGVVARSEVLVADVATLVPADVALKESSYVEETVVGSGVLRVERPYPVEVAVERLLVPR